LILASHQVLTVEETLQDQIWVRGHFWHREISMNVSLLDPRMIVLVAMLIVVIAMKLANDLDTTQ
jgi:hypothetical protein